MIMRAYSTVEATRCDPATTDLLSGQTVGTADSRHPHESNSQDLWMGVSCGVSVPS
jgi:hypothetical protein